jgi:hypothetical protein
MTQRGVYAASVLGVLLLPLPIYGLLASAGVVDGLGALVFLTQIWAWRLVAGVSSGSVDRVVITGASAGSFGAALNLSMVQDAFGNDARVDALLDSGAPFSDKYMPACMQKRWREGWGFADSLPADCTECRQADGGGMIRMADFLIKKHPNSTLAAVTSIHDEVIRLFFSVGVKNCANFDTIDPVMITMGQILDPTILYASADYEAGMQELRGLYKGTNRFATYFMGGANGTVHQHIFRARFTDPAAGSETIAKFIGNWLNGNFEHIGP